MDKTWGSPNTIMMLTCSGASNVGQLANQVCVELTQEGFGRMFCLAGMGGHNSGFVQSARDVPILIAIDGCPTGCTQKVLGHLEVPLKNHIVLTELGFEKTRDLDVQREHILKGKQAVRDLLQREPLETTSPEENPCCGSPAQRK
jgi:uncharacterized metal-binding protein